MQVHISVEAARGCGYRKPGKNGVGIYLVGPATGLPCGRLPFQLDTCPCCGAGIKPARSWAWIEPQKLFPIEPCSWRISYGSPSFGRLCAACPTGLGAPEGRHGLLWIGEQFYKNSAEFMEEARGRGISRKLSAIPREFELGKTWVYLAHRFAVQNPDDPNQMLPGIFSVFKPTGVDLVIDDEHDVPETALRLAEKLGDGARLVKVVRDVDTQATLTDCLNSSGLPSSDLK